jgi:hypothetical protein
MMTLRGLRFEGVGKMNFYENGEMDLNYALKLGVYKLHRWETC